MDSSATSGNVSTKYFGDKFDADKVEGYIHIDIRVHPPASVWKDRNTTIMFNIEKITMKEDSDNDKIKFGICQDCDIDADVTHWSRNVTIRYHPPPYYIIMNRKVSSDDINNMDLDLMPGFRLNWNYNYNVEPEPEYNSKQNWQFVR